MIWVGLVLAVLGAAAAIWGWRAATDARAATAAAHAEVAQLHEQLAELRMTLASVEPEPEPPVAPGDEVLGEDGLPTLTDPDTGLFNEQFFRVTLDTRVSAARRHLRPVAVVLLQVAEGVRNGTPAMVSPTVVAAGVRETLRDADTACRLDDGRFALILEDTPENGAVWTVERIRRSLAGEHDGQTLWAGIACYPAHAFDAWELFERAGQALVAAQEWHQDRIEVATSE